MMLVAVMACGSLAGCGGSSGGSGSSDKSSDSGSTASKDSGSDEGGASEGGKTLTVYAWDAGFNIPALEAAAEDYKNNVDSEFELNVVEQSASSDVENAITLAGSSGDYSQLPDIVLFQDHYFHKFNVDYPDAWSDVDDAEIDWSDFGEEKLSYSMIDGKHFGVPVDNGTVVAAYRTDILDECGYTIDDLTGITWDKFIEIGKDVYDKTGKYLVSMPADGNDMPYIMLQAEGVSQFEDGKPNLTGNDTVVKIYETLAQMIKENVLYMPNDWTGYTNESIVGDMVAGVINGNWIIPTIEQVAENSGKWEITTLPTLSGDEGYASNGGSSLYITSNCQNTDLAKDFLAKTFGGSTETYDNALKNGGVITCCISAGQSDVYQEGVDYFSGQPIYADIVEMGANVKPIEQSDFHYSLRNNTDTAIVNMVNGTDVKEALQDAQDQTLFEMGE